MPVFPVNKGVGKSVELKGLRAQYVIYAVLGILLSFVLFFLCSFILGQVAALICGIVAMVATVASVFYINGKFGENGLTRFFARKATPGRIAVNKRIYALMDSYAYNADKVQ